MIGFYTPLSPYLPIIGLISLIVSYWMDKYILLNRVARPNLIGSDLNESMIEMAEYFPFSIAIGNLIWMRKIGYRDGSSTILQLIAIGISAMNFIVPSRKLNKMIFKINELDDSEKIGSYDQNKMNFDFEYDRTNPITKESAIRSHLIKLKELNEDKAKMFLSKMKFAPDVNNGYGYNQSNANYEAIPFNMPLVNPIDRSPAEIPSVLYPNPQQ